MKSGLDDIFVCTYILIQEAERQAKEAALAEIERLKALLDQQTKR